MKHFIKAQAPIFEKVLSELHSGHKCSHWMWFIFPQIDGLGRSSTAKYYAIKNRDEALKYLNQTILGKRLIQCTQSVLAVKGRTASEIFGYPDDMKLKSSMTLFATVSDKDSVFHQLLDMYFDGDKDIKTVELLGDR